MELNWEERDRYRARERRERCGRGIEEVKQKIASFREEKRDTNNGNSTRERVNTRVTDTRDNTRVTDTMVTGYYGFGQFPSLVLA